jgi:hypothetical protein
MFNSLHLVLLQTLPKFFGVEFPAVQYARHPYIKRLFYTIYLFQMISHETCVSGFYSIVVNLMKLRVFFGLNSSNWIVIVMQEKENMQAF